MTPIEHYWPAEILVEAFPERFRHLTAKRAAEVEPVKASAPRSYTVETLEGGCQIYRLMPKLIAGGWR
jgi:hypothetical protein